MPLYRTGAGSVLRRRAELHEVDTASGGRTANRRGEEIFFGPVQRKEVKTYWPSVKMGVNANWKRPFFVPL